MQTPPSEEDEHNDDDDSCFDSDDEEDAEGGTDNTTSGGNNAAKGKNAKKKKRSRRAHKPTEGSSIETHMKSICEKAKKDRCPVNTVWMPPTNPLTQTLGGTAEPNKHHLSKHGFVFGIPRSSAGI